MFVTPRHLLQLATFAVALTANACATRDQSPARGFGPQVACAGGVIRTAADAARFGQCDEVHGDLRIAATSLDDLSSLARLQRVSGKLEISQNAELSDLSGLTSLAQVGELAVHDNPDLTDLSGLDSLRSARHVVISGNPSLRSLRGLEGLTRLELLVIEHNGLFRATGLSGLTDVGELMVIGNPKLNSLQGLSSLTHARSVEITNNPRLCARGMLPALARVDRSMTVTANRGLSKPDLRVLMGRVDRGVEQPGADGIAVLDEHAP